MKSPLKTMTAELESLKVVAKASIDSSMTDSESDALIAAFNDSVTAAGYPSGYQLITRAKMRENGWMK